MGGINTWPTISNSTANWYDYACYGDSITQGNEDGTGVTYPNVLQNLVASGRTVYNYGVGGQTSTQIAIRTGAIATTATISGGSIPASGSVTVTFASGQEPCTIQGPIVGNSGLIFTHGTLAGIPGAVFYNSGTYTFTRDQSAQAATTAATATFQADIRSTGAFNIIWVGRNDINSPSTVLANVASIVSKLASNRFLVLTVLNAEGEPSGSANYNLIQTINNGIATTYPNNYIDMRAYLISQYNTGNALDVIDHTNDIPPASLRSVNQAGTLGVAINSSVTTFTVSYTSNSLTVNSIMLVDSEYIYITGVSGTTVTSCTRGYGGTTSASHSNGVSWTGIDGVHPNAAGYTIVANRINTWLAANDVSPSGFVTSASIPSIFSSSPIIGNLAPNSAFFTSIAVNTNYAQAPLHINSQGTAILLGNGNNPGQVSTQFIMDQSGNGTLNISTFKQGGGYGNIRIQGNGGNLGVGPLGAGYPLTVSGTSGAADIAYFCSSGAANTNIKLDTQNTGYQTNLTFYSANVFKWQLGKNTDDSFFIYNSTGVANMTIYASSNAVIFNGGGSGNLGIGSYNLPAAKLDITGPTGSSTFTTSSYLGFVVRPGANGNYGGIDFTSPWGGADNPLARIALVAGSSGSFLNIGTSNNYNNGITSPGLAIDYLGYVAIGGKPIPGTGSFTSRFAIYNGLSNYANNAAALAGGLVAGDVYRNGDVMQIVH